LSIDERPAVVDNHRRLGDWEVDTIDGKGHRIAIVSLTERKSRLRLLMKGQAQDSLSFGHCWYRTPDAVSTPYLCYHRGL
jgi:IS30 family transposase